MTATAGFVARVPYGFVLLLVGFGAAVLQLALLTWTVKIWRGMNMRSRDTRPSKAPLLLTVFVQLLLPVVAVIVLEGCRVQLAETVAAGSAAGFEPAFLGTVGAPAIATIAWSPFFPVALLSVCFWWRAWTLYQERLSSRQQGGDSLEPSLRDLLGCAGLITAVVWVVLVGVLSHSTSLIGASSRAARALAAEEKATVLREGLELGAAAVGNHITLAGLMTPPVVMFCYWRLVVRPSRHTTRPVDAWPGRAEHIRAWMPAIVLAALAAAVIGIR